MIQIRQGIFETNSSSTHSMVMCMDDDHRKWAVGELLYYEGYKWNGFPDRLWKKNHFYTPEEAKEVIFSKNSIRWGDKEPSDPSDAASYAEWLRENGFYTLDSYLDAHDYSSGDNFDETFTTPSGEVVHAVGAYGYDG